MPKDNGEEFQKKLAAYRMRTQANVEEIKSRIDKILEPIPQAHGAEIDIALLEMGIDRYIDLHGIIDGLDLVTCCFKRRAERYRRSLQ